MGSAQLVLAKDLPLAGEQVASEVASDLGVGVGKNNPCVALVWDCLNWKSRLPLHLGHPLQVGRSPGRSRQAWPV